jgi:MFS family permease
MAFLLTQIKWLYNEFGLASVYHTGRDAWLIILARCGRMFAYGANSLIIALFFSALKFTDFYIGLFMTLTLLGDVLLSLFLTLVADKVGRRRILFLGSFLMVISGAMFAIFENFWVLLFAAVVGVISATGGDFGPFRAIEESTLSQLTTPETRADVLAWYVTTASLGSSIGTEISGRVVHFLQHRDGWTDVDAYHTIFWVYVGMGTLNMVFMLLLSANCEVEKAPEKDTSEMLLNEEDLEDDDEGEDNQDLQPTAIQAPQEPQEPKKQSLFAQISRETRSVIYKLWFLLIVDSLADGMTPYSLTTYYIDQKFHLAKSTLGDIVSISYFLSSCSTVFAGPLSRHLGLVNTMVFTHLPSSTAVLLFPLPRGVPMTVALFFLRTALNNMDQAPRSAFIAAVVKPEERTAVMGITSMLRTLASTAGPSVTGILAGNDRFWIAFVAAGALRICYDLGLFAIFVNMELHQHEEKDRSDKQGADPRQSSDEEELIGRPGSVEVRPS